MSCVRIGIHGATGKMGLELLRLAELESIKNNPTWRIGARLSRPSPQEIPTDGIGVWIDFSAPNSTLNLLEAIRTPAVIGTTGFSDSQLDQIKQIAKDKAILLSGNMSLGVAIVQQMLKHLPSTIPADINIIEEHHVHKRDSPSGTAKMLSETLKQNGFETVATHSIRAGDIVGTHRVKWNLAGEEIEIVHRASDRQIFARGAVLAAQWIVHQKPGLYQMSDVRGLI